MNYTQLAQELHCTRAGARQLVLRNQTKLKKCLLKENGKIVGIKDECLENVRQLKKHNFNTLEKKDYAMDKLNLEISFLKSLIEEKDKNALSLEKQIEELKQDKEKLTSQLSYYQNTTFLQRLLGYKK